MKYTIITNKGNEGYAKRQTYGDAMLCCYQIITDGSAFYAAAQDEEGNIVFELNAKDVFKNIIRNNNHKKLGIVCCMTKKEN